jgi:hypothetical protein
MNPDLLNILSGNNKDIDSQKLVEYLNGKLSAEEKHEIEQLMAGSDFMNDAVEGLADVKDKKDIQAYIEQLNKELRDLVEKKKDRRVKRRLKEYPWIYLTVILVLFLCIIGYFVVRQFLHLHSH